MRLSALLFCMFAAPAMAQDYPNRPVKILVPYGPGGATDIIARIVAQRLTESMGQTFLVENRPGANGNIAVEAVAKAPPDGYTLLVGNVSTNAINENAFAHQLQVKPSRDLVGIAKLVEITHVPYKGGAGQAIPAMIAGEVQVAFFNMASLLPHIKSGRLKALAAIPGQRLPELPNVPTLAEQGFPGIGTNAWQGMFAPTATPKPVVERLHGALVAILTRPDQREALGKQMMSVEVSKSPQEFTDLVRRETAGWGEFLREARIQID